MSSYVLLFIRNSYHNSGMSWRHNREKEKWVPCASRRVIPRYVVIIYRKGPNSSFNNNSFTLGIVWRFYEVITLWKFYYTQTNFNGTISFSNFNRKPNFHIRFGNKLPVRNHVVTKVKITVSFIYGNTASWDSTVNCSHVSILLVFFLSKIISLFA